MKLSQQSDNSWLLDAKYHEGANAADVNLTMRSDPDGRSFNVIYGQETRSFPLGNFYRINIDASGGEGKAGQNGISGSAGLAGEDGQPGEAGRAATANSYATNGKKGGNGGSGGKGGDGTNGGNGGPGGDAGKVTISVAAEDMDLLSLINQVRVNAGPGGKGGLGGKGGPGGKGGSPGSGGRGGDGYFKTLISPDSSGYARCQTISNDRGLDGDMGKRGSDGPKGADGQDGLPGQDGKAGTYQYIVTSGPAKGIYSSLYGHNLTNFTLSNEASLKAEPGEQLTVDSMDVENTGDMPTPKNHTFTYRISNSSSPQVVFDKSNEFTLPQSILARQKVGLSPMLRFEFAPQTVAENSVFSKEETINLAYGLPRIGMWRYNPSIKKNVKLAYPIKMSPIAGRGSVLPDAEVPMAFLLENTGNIALGKSSQSARPVIVRLQSDHKSVAFSDKASNFIPRTFSDDPLEKEHETLNPNSSSIVSGTLVVRGLNKLPDYTAITFTAELLLGSVKKPHDLTVIQKQTKKITLVDHYRYNPDAGIVLITNSETSVQSYNYWSDLAKTLVMELSIWNASLYNGFKFDYEPGEDGSLLTQWQDKTVVILNNQFHDDKNQLRRVTDYLGNTELFEAARKANISIYIIGPGFSFSDTNDVPQCKEVRNYNNLSDLLDLTDESSTSISSDSSTGSSDTNTARRAPVESKYFFTKPNQEKFEKKVQKFSIALKEQQPAERHIIIHHFSTKVLELGFSWKWEEGTVEIRPGLNPPLQVKIIHRHKEDKQYKLDSSLNVYQILKLMPFTQKLNFVITALNNEVTEQLLRLAIISDLVEEQAYFRQDKSNGNVPKERLAKSLHIMQTLLQYDYSDILASRKGYEFVINVFVIAAFVAKRLTKGREYFLFNRRGMKLTDICITALIAWLKNTLSLSDSYIKQRLKVARSNWSDKCSEEIQAELICPPSFIGKTTQNNWVKNPTLYAKNNLPEVTHNSSQITSSFGFFSDEDSRAKAVEVVETTAKTLSFSQ